MLKLIILKINERRRLNGDRIKVSTVGKKVYMKKIVDQIKKDQYKIILREKNEMFINQFKLDKIKIKKMLLVLKYEDIIYLVKDIEYLKYGPEKLVVFKKQYQLVDKYGNNKKVLVYIKIKMKEGILPIISFHQNE